MKNKIKLGLVAVAVTLLLSGSTMNNFDTEEPRFPNPLDCGTYFQYFMGFPVLMHCPTGLWYCAELDTCSWKHDPTCLYWLYCYPASGEPLVPCCCLSIPVCPPARLDWS